MSVDSSRFPISSLWVQVALLTFVVGFAVLGYLAYRISWDQPPIPSRVLDEEGRAVFTRKDIMSGQHVFQKYGLMQHGTIFGHGAYLGPDFTAQYLHLAIGEILRLEGGGVEPSTSQRGALLQIFKANRYDPETDTLVFYDAQTAAYRSMVDFYADYFGELSEQEGLKRPHIGNHSEIEDFTGYIAWATWVATAKRPGQPYSYTNNWPPEPLAGNYLTAEAVLWSAMSLIALLGGAGLLFFLIGRYDWLGWHRVPEEEALNLRFRSPEKVGLTPAQRAVPWYFLVVAGLFLAQGLLGGANAHYHVEPAGFYGLEIAEWLPYNLSRMWHLQLALFFVSASFLAMGIFLAPMIARSEPPHQEKLALLLFGALVLVVVGSLIGEALSIHGFFETDGPWFWVGAQGWEYLDLGRLWQILLVLGMVLWLVILVRGLRARLRREHPGNLPWLFIYSALSIPLFYAAGLVFGKSSSYAIVDFWRFWVVHLWVEDFLELFTTVMVAFIFVLLRVVRPRVATLVVYLDIILYSVGGVIGTMHHLYFSGAPAVHMALGAFFSAMEVIPLLLLTFEAWRFVRLGGVHGKENVLHASDRDFPHKWAVMFLIAVGFWNFLGAGVFGFLINLPVVSYYEIGTQFTANHGHGAMMGVYGMLAIGFFIFVARYFVPADQNTERAMKISFWSLNLGLAWMVFVNLGPVGTLQLYDAVRFGYWHARELEFFEQPLLRVLEWARLPGDLLFIVGGIGPVVYLALRMFAARRRDPRLKAGEEIEEFVEADGRVTA